ncbi:MAG TPA: helix-turn-helix transcriptional regulator [Kaistia sp.]|nr:helix-turn-helix transcriptional regulator [Kaistia sp.]
MLNEFDPGKFELAAAVRGDTPIDPTAVAPEEPVSVQALREMRGLGVVELAGLAGILPDHLRAIEAGVEPTTPERQAIAAALNVPVDRIA